MSYKLSVPARINILGNPADANEGDFATISAAVELRAGAIVEPARELVLEALQRSGSGFTATTHLELDRHSLPFPYDGHLDLLKGAVNQLFRYSDEFQAKFARQGVRIATWTDVPRQSGLGGSSLFVLLALAGLRLIYDLDRRIHNDYVLAELAQRVEARELSITCGFADRYVPLFGGIAYLDYRGKLLHEDVCQEPYVTYERLDTWVEDLPLVAMATGIERDSGDVHGQMRPRYLEEHRAWRDRGGEPPPMVQFMTAAWETAWRGKMALLRGDWEAFGALMNRNHRLVHDMMAYCCFEDGAGWANNLLVDAALANGALGAKLTGAGGGGSVFALTRPGQEEQIMEIWKQAAAGAGLTSAAAYRLRISRSGLVVEVD
jgi:galactokinase/mevalonate kinase-like predicted kinase